MARLPVELAIAAPGLPMTTVIVAEKPSVARDIAAVLGVRGKGDGFLQGNGYRITWALGHLVHFAEPDDYDAAWAGRWSMGQLPMIPEQWKLRTDKRTVKQFKTVKALMTSTETESVVCATDAGREGELIFRLIAEHARCRKPVQRLWISSLTEEAIRDGLERLRPGSDYDPLAAAARARAQADWLVGMNLTRAYSVHNRMLCTIGRVQTPALAMIVERDAIIASFNQVFYYELLAHLAEGFDARYNKDGETRIDKKEQAEKLQRAIGEAIEPDRTGTVQSVQKKVRNNRPPPLYDLTNLQRDANRRFGFTAAKVLELAQALYETHKLISYPRTESRHIGEDMLPQLPEILRQIDHPLADEAARRLAAGHRLGKAYVDKTRLTDHHAILPTAKRPPASLPDPLRKVYDLVAARFVGVFLPDQRVEETRVTLNIGGETFVAKGSVELESGWKRVEPRRRATGEVPASDNPDASDRHRALPPLRKGQIVHVEGLDVVEKETQPPRPFDDATLLNAMKHAGRDIDDDALAAAMKTSGLGTPATRAEIIEKLLRTGYIARERKQLRATDKGKALIGMVAEPLRSVETTAAWEQRLKDVEQGSGDAGAFYQDICTLIGALIPQVEQGPAMSTEQVAAANAASPGRGRSGRGGA
ncbi:MAG: DNA topoisomerase 3, partial [Thiohalocapsa sp.]